MITLDANLLIQEMTTGAEWGREADERTRGQDGEIFVWYSLERCERVDRDEKLLFVLSDFEQVTTQRDADRRIGERLGDEVEFWFLSLASISSILPHRIFVCFLFIYNTGLPSLLLSDLLESRDSVRAWGQSKLHTPGQFHSDQRRQHHHHHHQLEETRKKMEKALAETEGPLRVNSENVHFRSQC